MSGLDEVADELYALSPADFVATRNARAKQAKADGDRDLAAAITALGKPTKVAWLANQLVRQRRDDVEPLLELAAGLREATASLSGEDLRRLTKQQHQLVYALVQQAKSLAGGPVTQDVADGIEATLRAALADGDLAAQLLAGRLTDGLEFAGFGGAGYTGLSLVPDRPAKKAARPAKPDRSAEAKEAARRERLAEARRLLAEARESAAGARAAREAAAELAANASAKVNELRERVDRLRTELDETTSQQTTAEQDERSAKAALQRSERTASSAERRLTQAEAAAADDE